VRIHTDATYATIRKAAAVAQVELRKCDEHNSRTHSRAFEVSLRGDSRRRPNFYNGDGSYAATWDQWGIFLAEIFTADKEARAGGTVKAPMYADAEDFDAKTRYRFDGHGIVPNDMHGDHRFQYAGIPYMQKCTKCSASFTWAR
jgi:hypothetical protein